MPRATVLLHAVPDRFRTGSRHRIARCRDCHRTFTDPIVESYPPEYEPFRTQRQRTRTTGTRAAIVRVFYEGRGTFVERAVLWLPYLLFRARDRMKMKARDLYVHPFRRRGRLLDVGCGSGSHLELWRCQQSECSGVEPHEATARTARERLGMDIRAGTLEQQKFPAASFDVVTFAHVLEHVPDPDGVLREAARLLRPGGEILVWVPGFDSLLRRFFGPAWFPYEVPRHRWHFRHEELCSLLRDAGLSPVEIGFDANEWTFRQSVLAWNGPAKFLLSFRKVRLLILLACRIFRRTDAVRIRAVRRSAP